MANVTWEPAKERCEEMGGHLATVKNLQELEDIIRLVEQYSPRYVWLGGYRDSEGHWRYVTGETMNYARWDTNEPSARDIDGTAEDYLIMWMSPTQNIWCFNDTRNDPASILPLRYNGYTCFICQFDEVPAEE